MGLHESTWDQAIQHHRRDGAETSGRSRRAGRDQPDTHSRDGGGDLQHGDDQGLVLREPVGDNDPRRPFAFLSSTPSSTKALPARLPLLLAIGYPPRTLPAQRFGSLGRSFSSAGPMNGLASIVTRRRTPVGRIISTQHVH